MTTLVHAVLRLGETGRAACCLAAALIWGLLDVAGMFKVAPRDLDARHVVAAALWVGLFGHAAIRRFKADERGRLSARQDLELGLLLLVGVHAVVQLAGGLRDSIYPLVYILVAFMASFAVKPAGIILVGIAMAFEAILYFGTEGYRDPKPFAAHATFIVLFGLLNIVFTRAEIVRVRKRSGRLLAQDKAKALDDARRYRLSGAPAENANQDEERLLRSGVEEIHRSLYYTLDLLKRTLGLHTCVLLFLSDDGTQFSVGEVVSESDDMAPGPFRAGEGAVGALVKRVAAMSLEHIKPGYRGLCYYRSPSFVKAFLGVPVLERSALRGVLCADRLEDRPFTAHEEEVLTNASHHVLRTIENERVFMQLERSKREQGVLHRASQALGAALTEDAVIDAGLSAAADIAKYSFGAVTLYDPQSLRHELRRAVGDGAVRFTGLSFEDNASLTAMAVKNRHYLPYRGEYDEQQQVVFTRKATLEGMRSLLILPLLVRETPVGTLVLAARQPNVFASDIRPTFQVLANQLAVALANAKAVRRLEELATTDGLTGCLNKRAFLDELTTKIKAAERFGRKLTLIVSDIDHFKAVNDTYGHATGDVVLRGLGEILHAAKRETDIVARFGGEEFCVLCEETDTSGALQLAERIREELKARLFSTELGELKVTTSLGVAEFPRDATRDQQLFEAADKALYQAKQTGRDRVCSANQH